jgi:chromate reductase, NAD(P)H dehydrogenase (quinone)
MTTIIAATNRNDSNTLHLANYYKARLSEKNFDSNILSLSELPDNIVTSYMYNKPIPEFQNIQSIVTQTEKFLFIIPEYNGSFPGILKLFVDVCKYPESFKDKKAALVGLSTGKYGNIRGVDHFTGVCHYMGLNVMPMKIHIPNIKQEFNEDLSLFKEDTLKYTNEQIERFIKF